MELIKNIYEFFKFIDAFAKLLRENPITIFKCETKEFEKKFPNLYEDLKKYYKFVKGTVLPTHCSQSFIDNFYELKQITLKQIIAMKNIKHRLKKDSQVYTVGTEFYSHESPSLTNEICEAIYKKYGMTAFDYYDENWRKNEQLTVEKYTSETNKINLKEFFVAEHSPAVETKPEMMSEYTTSKTKEVIEAINKEVGDGIYPKAKEILKEAEKISKEQLNKDLETLVNEAEKSVKISKQKPATKNKPKNRTK